jgi:hypothetical protein
MAEAREPIDNNAHRELAIDVFNRVWGLLDKTDRTVEEDDTMVHAAHASRDHWARSVRRSSSSAANGRSRASTRS